MHGLESVFALYRPWLHALQPSANPVEPRQTPSSLVKPRQTSPAAVSGVLLQSHPASTAPPTPPATPLPASHRLAKAARTARRDWTPPCTLCVAPPLPILAAIQSAQGLLSRFRRPLDEPSSVSSRQLRKG
ncbi:hypothetical protein P153DRAFT_385938 [Dothidotthia symphoricarpi CBS 119687]|uniref:Uncharacterized protein n=1 Tax=Dothidotthia symphoricarpi CBS 119687 TaxID=1392245 RepID=A0A6A6ACT9_9PLEO|nr:uncharacterized protein P153DRAFT_385938 [Dothidotthia symphoricarpi CBS 119687]KAF2128728.1 hypothetical protein P153DRAFT_385938 [Dothidotthia symphoricarpi CBS 119687]